MGGQRIIRRERIKKRSTGAAESLEFEAAGRAGFHGNDHGVRGGDDGRAVVNKEVARTAAGRIQVDLGHPMDGVQRLSGSRGDCRVLSVVAVAAPRDVRGRGMTSARRCDGQDRFRAARVEFRSATLGET